jgi:hypothetical protein
MNANAGLTADALAKVGTEVVKLPVVVKSDITTKLKLLEVPLGAKVLKEG